MLIAAAGLALVVVLPLAATAAIYAAGRDRGTCSTEPLRPAGTALAFVHEWIATIALLGAWPWQLSQTRTLHAPRGVVLFVPERVGSSAAFWYLRRRLRAAGWDGIGGIARFPRDAAAVRVALEARIAALPAGTAVVVIGHGIGGRSVCHVAAAHPDWPIRCAVSLGTPHRGSGALPYRLLGGAAAPEPTSAPAGEVIALYSDFDAWLQPVDNAYCPGAFNIAVSGIGHCAMLLSPRVADLIVENLNAPLAADARS